jgi:hypothetical protein
MKIIELTTTEFDGRIFFQQLRKNNRLYLVTDTYKIIFSKRFIKIRKNYYRHEDWKKFSFKDFKEMPNLEVQFWSKWGSFMSKLFYFSHRFWNKEINNGNN